MKFEVENLSLILLLYNVYKTNIVKIGDMFEHFRAFQAKILYTRWEICHFLHRCKIVQPFKCSGSDVSHMTNY